MKDTSFHWSSSPRASWSEWKRSRRWKSCSASEKLSTTGFESRRRSPRWADMTQLFQHVQRGLLDENFLTFFLTFNRWYKDDCFQSPIKPSLILYKCLSLCSSSALVQYVREPSSDSQPCLATTSIPKSGSSGMIQYLQSWFPGWGGWYGDSQDPDRPDELLPSPSSWDILGERLNC